MKRAPNVKSKLTIEKVTFCLLTGWVFRKYYWEFFRFFNFSEKKFIPDDAWRAKNDKWNRQRQGRRSIPIIWLFFILRIFRSLFFPFTRYAEDDGKNALGKREFLLDDLRERIVGVINIVPIWTEKGIADGRQG